MARVELKVTMTGIYSYERPAYGYGTETAYIYKMTDDDNKVYVWKTTKFWCEAIPVADDAKNGYHLIDAKGKKWTSEKINKGDVLIITAGVKGETEYNGEAQTELTRVKLKERIFKAESYEAIQARKEAEKAQRKQEQLNSITGADFIWKMPYRQFKEHYSDCETVIDSFERDRHGESFIKVIIREGRLKNSGVRGKHYKGFEFFFDSEGKEYGCTFRAISEETALRQLKKAFPKATNIQPGQIFNYI